jgi:hypothetical protein
MLKLFLLFILIFLTNNVMREMLRFSDEKIEKYICVIIIDSMNQLGGKTDDCRMSKNMSFTS